MRLERFFKNVLIENVLEMSNGRLFHSLGVAV